MKTLKRISFILTLAFTTHTLVFGQICNLTTGYVGNTFDGGTEWVQNYSEELDVASDGTMVTTSTWDENGRCIGVWKDGHAVTLLKQPDPTDNCWGWGTGTQAAAIDNNYLYAVNCLNNILRWNRNVGYSYVDKTNVGASTDIAVGMTYSADYLYLVKASGLVEKRSVSSLGTVALSFTVTGGYDLAVDNTGNIWVLTTNKEVLKFNASGINTGTKIASQAGWSPSAVNFDAKNTLLLVPDNGVRRQVIKFNTTGAQVGTFGDLGGISGGPTPGLVGDLRFWNIAGCGTDSIGNIYVALNEIGTSLRKFNSSGIKQWEVQGLFFVDQASIDPASDGNDIYGVNEHMKFDYNTNTWSLRAITCDAIANPTDRRITTSPSTSLMRRVNGNLLMFVADMYAGYFDVYRFNGEIAVFCQTISGTGFSALPDKNGNVWYVNGSSIRKIPLTGFTNGIPVFGPEVIVASSIPAPFTGIERLEYDADTDVMYIGGWTATDGNTLNDWGIIGSTIARYPNWSTGNRTASNTVVPPKDGEGYCMKAMSVAGDYVFVGGSRDRGSIYVFNANDLSLAGNIPVPESMGLTGWLDVPHAIQAYKKSNGQYLILVEEDSKGKNILYQWCAPGGCNGITGNIKLTGTQSDNISPYCCNNDGINAFDGDIGTFVDAEASSGGYTQLDLGSLNNIRTIKYYPRANFASRMLGGSFQGSNDGINFTTVFTIAQTPAYDWNSTSVNTNCRYIRYVSPTNGYCNVAELEFWGSSTIFSATGVTVSPAAVSISIGNTLQLTPTVLPTYTTNQLVSWSSSNPSIASVNSTGIVTANATSSATITVTTQDGNKTATCIVNSTSFFTDSKLSGILFDNITPYGGGDTDGNRAFDGNTATYVDANTISGGYTGIDFGSVLTVTTIKYYPRANFASRMIGGTFQGSNDGINFTTVFTIAQTPAYDWNVTTVNANCRYLRYLSPANGYCNVAELEFWGRSVAIPTTGVSINPTSASIIVGATQQLTASVLPANATNQAVSWSSSNYSIASVNSTGLVTANAPGSATITVTTQDGSRTATCTFTCTSVCIDSKLMGTQFDNITPYGGADADGNRAFDGNTATYVDAEANTGGYTGIDFGSSRTVSTIKFFPRANFESRMTGGIFQGSTDGSIYTDVYTISGNPTNAWTSVTVNVSYRYMRYLGPTNGYCNVAEIEFWGGCSLRSNSPQVLNLATSVNPASVSETIDMFPNPIKVGGILHVNGCKDATINIFNIDGKLMFNAKLTNNSLALPVSIKSGLYLVSINANHHVLKGKLNVK